MLEALEADLKTDWMTLKKPDDFRAMSALPDAAKRALFAWASALAIKPQLFSDNNPSPVIEEIGTRLRVDVAACWRPTASTYWGRVNKGHAVSMARDLISDDYAEERNRERKGDIAAAMERAFAEDAAQSEGFDIQTAAKTLRWLPDVMGFQSVPAEGVNAGGTPLLAQDIAGAAPQITPSRADDEPDVLPAFLSDDAA